MNCKVQDILINYEIIGEGKPVIIIHGSHVDHRLMKGCMEPIFNNSNKYKRIYLDLPGMGKTKAPKWLKASDMMLAIILEFIETVIPNTDFLLVGESYGGYLSRGIIYKLSNRVEGLLLLCPVIISDFKKRSTPNHVILKEDKKLLSQLDPVEAKGFNKIQVVQSKQIWQRYKNEILTGVKLADNKFLEGLQEEGYAFSFEVDKMKEAFNKPMLMVLGRQDSIVGYKDAWNILDNFPRGTFAVLDKAGHNLQIEQPDVFNSLVKEWLARVDEESIDK